MQSMRIFLAIGLFLVAGILVAGCTQQATPVPTTTTAAATAIPTTAAATATTVAIANPAAVNCENLGGTVEINTDATGDKYGMCTFANGTSCDEWALFRGEGCKAYAGPTATGTQMELANPASVNCVNLNGTVEMKKDATGGDYGMCTFANGTSCEEWALFKGEGCKAYSGPSATPATIANPAAVNCVNLGGTVEMKKNATGEEYGMCKFANGTSCDEWALFRGEGCKAGA